MHFTKIEIFLTSTDTPTKYHTIQFSIRNKMPKYLTYYCWCNTLIYQIKCIFQKLNSCLTNKLFASSTQCIIPESISSESNTMLQNTVSIFSIISWLYPCTCPLPLLSGWLLAQGAKLASRAASSAQTNVPSLEISLRPNHPTSPAVK